MRLGGSLMNENRYHEHLADVNVASDTHEEWGEDCIRRLVEGTITRRGTIWNDYIGFWSKGLALGVPQPIEFNGRRYMTVTLLQVDHDVYTPYAWVNIEGLTIRLILLEHFYDKPEDYRAAVEERNRRVQEYLDWIDRGEFTKNDMRELTGLPRLPQFEQPVPPEAVAQFKERLLNPSNDLLRNVLH